MFQNLFKEMFNGLCIKQYQMGVKEGTHLNRRAHNWTNGSLKKKNKENKELSLQNN